MVSSLASQKILRSSLLEHLLVVWNAEPSEDGLVKTLQILSFNSIRVTPWRFSPDDEPRETEQPLRIDVRPVHADLLPPISTEPAFETRLSWLDPGTHLAASTGAAMTQGPSRDHTEQCRTRIINSISSDVALNVRVRDAHERMSRPASDAEPNMKKVRFSEHATELVSPAVSTTHTSFTSVVQGGSSSSSAPPQATPTVCMCDLTIVTSTLVQRSRSCWTLSSCRVTHR